MEDLIFAIVIVPYFFLIHIGIVTWLVSFIASIVKMTMKPKFTLLKLVTSIYGIGVGLALPIFENYYGGGDAPTAAVYAILPAFVITSRADHVGLTFYLPYIVFGLVGGWGLGQFIHWLTSWVKKQ